MQRLGRPRDRFIHALLPLLRRVRSRSMWAQSLIGGDALQHCHRAGLLEYRMLRFEPERLRLRTGLRTFNAAVSGGSPVDYLAIYRYSTETLRAPIRSVLIGVESPAFAGRLQNYPAVGASTILGRFLPPHPLSTVEARRLLLHILSLEKALQEVEHELTCRPEWAALPLRAVLRLLEGG